MERFGDGLGDGGADLDAACSLVVGDLQAEGVEDLALDLRWGLAQGIGEIRDSREECSRVLVGAGIDRGGGEAAELDLGCVLGFSELGDPLADQVGLDPAFQRGDLQADAPVEVADLVAQLALPGVGLLARGLLVGTELAGELVEAHGAEDPLGEELLDEREEGVFAEGEPLAVAVDLLGGDLAVGASVVAGHVGVALALAPVHGQRLVARSTAHHAGEQVGGLAVAPAVGAVAVLAEAPLGCGEQIVEDQRQVLDLADDPLVTGTQAGGPAGLALGREVQPVPDQPARVGGVAQHRPQRRLRPIALEVALGVDVAGRGRPACPVEVIGDRLAPPALVGPQVEDLGHYRGCVWVGLEAGLDLASLGTSRHWMLASDEPVAVWRPAAAAEALQRGLAHPALGLARELGPLVLVEGLLQCDQQPTLGRRGIAGADRVVDLHTNLAQLTMEQPGGDPVAGQAGGL